MNVVGLITEHNPFHNGHLYHLKKARALCQADFVVSVMSGHFLQRGEPALFNKWARAKMAVLGGADLVVELPTAFSTRSASAFALGSVSLLNSMGVVTHICFGSESGDIDELWPAARLVFEEPPEFKTMLHKFLAQGYPYPAARGRAIEQFLVSDKRSSAGFFSTPNNILGIEYLQALLTLESKIKPLTIRRFSAGFHDPDIDEFSAIASATSIREELLSQGTVTDKIKAVVPPSSLAVMEHEISAGCGPVFLKDYAKLLFYLLRTTPADLISKLNDVTEGLENRIIQVSRSVNSVEELLAKVKTKRYTWTRLQRILAYILLGYTRSMAQSFDATGPRYIRVLGLSGAGRTLLKAVKKKASLPVIIRTAPYLSKNDDVSSMLRLDVKATDIYTLLYPGPAVAPPGLDCKIMPFVGG